MAKFEKVIHLPPDEPAWRAARWGPFLYALTEKLPPRDKQALIKYLELSKAEVDLWQKVGSRVPANWKRPCGRRASASLRTSTTWWRARRRTR